MRNGEFIQMMYTPIPQNMTDSESEEEFRLQISTCPLKNSQIVTQNPRPASVHATITRFNYDTDNRIMANALPNVRFAQSAYCPSNDSGHSNRFHHNRLPSDADNVAILNTSLKKIQPMSMARKLCFVTSIVVCVLTVIYFIWMVPCSDQHSCPARSERTQTHNWQRSYERVELKGAINVVHGLRGRSMNLVFMYRGNHFFTAVGESNAATKRNGIISLIGTTGQVAWYDELINEPSIIDCNLIDADWNGENDCLVIDEYGEMGCINPISGQWLWHIPRKSQTPPDKLNFPLVVPDLNKDNVKDLLITCTTIANNRTYNALKLISGANGKQIGQSYAIEKCSSIHKFQIDDQLKVSYNCIINDNDIRITKPLQDLYGRMTKQNITLPETMSDIASNQHKFYGQRKDTLSQSSVYSIHDKELIVENYGVCPDACNVTVTLLEKQNGQSKIIRNFNGTRMYGMVPARLSFNNSHDPSKTAVHGFVIKFWEWSANETDPRPYPMEKRESDAVHNATTAEFNRFDSVLRKKRSWDAIKVKRDTDPAQTNASKSKNVAITLSDRINSAVLQSQMRLIKETVVLIVFNSTDIRIENTSQNNIVQFCRTDSKRHEVCQPDLNNQENSLLIADLDQDGSQELVSYYSTFVESENEVNKWKLITYVQLLRLESELPKLYATDEKH